MNHIHKRRMMIALIAAAGSLLAVSIYMQADALEPSVTHAQQTLTIDAPENP